MKRLLIGEAIIWKRKERNDKSLILLPFLFLVILYCHKDYTKRSFVVYTIKCVFMCPRVYVRTHKGSIPAFSLIDVTSPPADRVTLMHSTLQFVSVPENVLSNTHFMHTRAHAHTHTHTYTHTHCVLVNKAVLA